MRDKFGRFMKGHTISIATKKKMSKAKKGNSNGFQKGQEAWNKDEKMPYKSRPYQKGKPAWNKGQELPALSLKHRLKISKSHKKIAHKCHFWKGGITPLHFAIRNCFEYRQWRDKIFQQDNYICVECGQVGGSLEAHHSDKTFAELFAEFLQEYNQFSPHEDIDTLVRLAMKWQPFWTAEGETLCENCHNKKKRRANHEANRL